MQPPRSQCGNDREMTTSPPGHHALTMTAKLQQLRANSREMTTIAESCIRTHRIGANPEKSDLVNFRGLD